MMKFCHSHLTHNFFNYCMRRFFFGLVYVAFSQMQTQTSLCSPLLSLETPNDVQSVAEHSLNIQATSEGSDQTARMRRLI